MGSQDKGKPPPGEGWLGGRHRDRGCLGAALVIAGAGLAGVVAIGYAIAGVMF